MINELADICKNMLLNKILLVPSYAVGQNIIRTLASKTPVFNLRIETIKSITDEFGKPLLSDGSVTLADDNMSRQKMFAIIYNMQQNKEFEYFADIPATPSISNSIWNAVMEIKYSGISGEELDEACFVCTEKGRDIKRIIKEHDLLLKNEGLIDYPGLIMKILQDCTREDTLLLVPNSIKLRCIEKKLITRKFRSIQVLHDEPVKGLSVSGSYYCSNYPEKKEHSSPFAALYALDEEKNNRDFSFIRLMKAYGENNEVDAVLRDIISKEIPFDNVCIYASTQEPYAQLLYQGITRLGIDATFGYGISVMNSRPGKVFSSVKRWIESDYQVSYLVKMLYQELIQVSGEEDESIKPFQAANVLRASGIGWGRERYLPVLDEKLSFLQKESSTGEDNELNRIKILSSVRQFIDTAFNMIPHSPDQNVSLDCLAKGVAAFVNRFAQVKSALDAEARNAIVESLNQISLGLSVEISEGLRILESNIKSIRIGVSSPNKGHIHLTDFDNGFCINRMHNYFIGLDADRFPGKFREDPILLDVEKEKISENILKNSERPGEAVYRLIELMSGLNGNITMVYSAFDPAENRDKVPSSFILQVYRMISGNILADYSDLKNYFGRTEGYITENALDETGLWLGRYYKYAGESLKETVYECYPHLKQGGIAWDNQNSDKFTCYDGFVGKLEIKTGGEVFSASKFELLAKCPYKYFLQYVLNLTLPEELVYDPEIWLDPLQKGSLYHTVFELFYKTISKKNEKPSRKGHSTVILEIAEWVIKEYKKQIPPPNEIVFEIERREILESCLIFLAGEEENADTGKPVDFELAFGPGNENYPAIEITLPSERKFLLSGKIDRIDKLDENTYRIVDYKSGGTYGFGERDFFKGGRQIQHALYAYACEILLKKNSDARNVRVKEGVYLFPTKKGEGRRFIRVQRDLSEFFRLLDDLFTVMEEGTFAATEDSGDCRWCDYNVVCRVHRLQNVIAAKKNDESVDVLAALRRLADYE